jgi:hypothetical protein
LPAVARKVGRTRTGRQGFEGWHWLRCRLMEIRIDMGRSKAHDKPATISVAGLSSNETED